MNYPVITAVLLTVSIAALAALAINIFRSASRIRRQEESFSDEKGRLAGEADALRQEVMRLSNEKTALESTLKARNEYEELRLAEKEAALQAQKEQHEKDLENMKDAFKALSAENSSAFRKQSAESISELLKPIQEKFSEFDRSVRESQKENAVRNEALRVSIEDVMKQSQTIGNEAKNLANALTGYSKVQGDFGEMLLTDVLKNAGLTEGIHFFTQSVMTDRDGHEIKSEDGRTMIPDVMVCYPDDTIVIIDSKVSLKAYQNYFNSESAEDRIRFAKEHAESVRNHVNELKAKDYASYLPEGKRKVAYNIMFIPIEGAFRLMLEVEPTLWQAAKDNNVLIVSQMTLIIVLNMIQMAWKQADQEKNIADVYRTAEELMGQLNGWMSSFETVGTCLEKATEAFGNSRKKLCDSNQSVIRKIQKLENLKLAPKRSRAKVRPGARKAGPESIIPQSFLTGGHEDPGTDEED